MKILVTGASGLLGSRLVRELLSRNYEVIAIYNRNPILVDHERLVKVRLNIVDKTSLEDLILKTKPDVIVHAAAYTDVDGCERDKAYAWKVNVEATRSIVRAARVVKSHLIYVSTDYVFDGEKGLYKEDDVPNPVNYYGLTKLVGEELVRASDLLYTIVRPSAIYGVGGSKKSFAEYVAEKLSRGEKVYALVEQYVSPTHNTLLAMAIAEIVEMRPMGILHVAGERMNRYEFATKIAEALELPVELVEKASVKDMKYWVAKRPRDSSLDTSKAKSLLKTKFYDISLALELFKQEWLEAKSR
ncbi:MAG: dTDP-4-dehydrorhamnose reductase [Thermoprotei archaeon]|nr:MAG: dTDP-4-dehydrorhamnose reductase [Thermoprotei archaeon]